MFKYTNNNTGEVRLLDDRSARLDRLTNWSYEEVQPDDAGAAERRDRAVSRAEAERQSIEAAAASRAKSATKFH